ncbi:SDR family NAD(P)-dependent oxidoreductase [Embleya sp. NPDC059259]|uniref:SDR family NAD(P)-dependent oxidoreductase n=1 Tax=unclassified Embleya TaxID=2699296 RepID=UPI00368B2C07
MTETSSGIGLHTAIGLAAEGIRVVPTMRDTAKADRLRAEAADRGVEVAVRRPDVTDLHHARWCLDAVAAELGVVDREQALLRNRLTPLRRDLCAVANVATRTRTVLTEHAAIVAALRTGDADRVGESLATHLSSTLVALHLPAPAHWSGVAGAPSVVGQS